LQLIVLQAVKYSQTACRLSFSGGASLPGSVQNPEVSDTTDGDSSTEAGQIIKKEI